MKVKAIMSKNLRVCGPATDLASAARIMAERNCGVLPVVSDEGEVLGIITDRDICLYAGERLLPLNKLFVREVIRTDLHYCAPDDDVKAALAIMRDASVRRLPVLSAATGALVGMLSIDDIILLAGDGNCYCATFREVVETMKAFDKTGVVPVAFPDEELGVSAAG